MVPHITRPPTTMSGSSLDSTLRHALSVKALGQNLYQGDRLWKPKGNRGVFGGQLIGQALMAAMKSVDDPEFLLHSTHCYFLSPVKPEPIVYEVDKSRDGRTFCSRSVKAIQDGKTVFLCLVSFRKSEEVEGVTYSNLPSTMPDVPLPGESNDHYKVLKLSHHPLLDAVGIELYVCYSIEDMKLRETNQPVEPKLYMWLKPNKSFNSEEHQNFHRVALAFGSDFRMAFTITLKYPDVTFSLITSLDHSIWFHKPIQSGLWHLFVIECENATGGTALNVSRIFCEDGSLVATCKQESLCRPKL